jgi:hypothetical protein
MSFMGPQHTHAMSAQPLGTALVMTDLVRVIMPPAIDFDTQCEIAA